MGASLRTVLADFSCDQATELAASEPFQTPDDLLTGETLPISLNDHPSDYFHVSPEILCRISTRKSKQAFGELAGEETKNR